MSIVGSCRSTETLLVQALRTIPQSAFPSEDWVLADMSDIRDGFQDCVRQRLQ